MSNTWPKVAEIWNFGPESEILGWKIDILAKIIQNKAEKWPEKYKC